jgi:hypothetical protein
MLIPDEQVVAYALRKLKSYEKKQPRLATNNMLAICGNNRVPINSGP